MKTISARNAKNAFGHLIDLARAEPVKIEKHGRGVVVVLAIEEFERLTASEAHPLKNISAAVQTERHTK